MSLHLHIPPDDAPARDAATPRPCLFCGGNAIADSIRTADFVQHYMRCRSCACEGPWANTRWGAADAWNRRPAHDALVAALRAVCEWDDYSIRLPDAVTKQVRAALALAEGATP